MMLKDDMSNANVLINAIHSYLITSQAMTEHGAYEIRDVMWVRPPQNQCTSKFTTGKVTMKTSNQHDTDALEQEIPMISP